MRERERERERSGNRESRTASQQIEGLQIRRYKPIRLSAADPLTLITLIVHTRWFLRRKYVLNGRLAEVVVEFESSDHRVLNIPLSAD